MKILIIEDEQNNADRLVRLIRTIKPDAEIADVLSSNEEIKQFFEHETVLPDVIFADIQLGDGLSFEGLKLAPQSVPVVFTTAYDKYAIQAFKFNSLDYLLKPIDFDELRLALLKVEKKTVATLEAVSHLLETVGGIRYRERFLIARRDTFNVVFVNELSHICIKDGVVRLYTVNKKSHTFNLSLDDLEQQLDPKRFMRVNRQFIVSATSVEKLSTFFLGKIRIHLKEYPDLEIIVSREKVASVKKWLNY